MSDEVQQHWTERARHDPEWAIQQLMEGLDEVHRLHEEIRQLKNGIIDKGDHLIDQLQLLLEKDAQIQLERDPFSRGTKECFPGESRFQIRVWKRYPDRGWTTFCAHTVRDLISIASQSDITKEILK